ncbi:MAG: Rieske (2Fe-2S) protein, partial [Polynucleobacter victoriensis]
SLSKGKINFMGEIVCPWHGYRFNLKTGVCAERYPDLPVYEVKIDEEGFFIGL